MFKLWCYGCCCSWCLLLLFWLGHGCSLCKRFWSFFYRLYFNCSSMVLCRFFFSFIYLSCWLRLLFLSCFNNWFGFLNFWLFLLLNSLFWMFKKLLFLFFSKFHGCQRLNISKLNFLTGSSIIIVKCHRLKFNFLLTGWFFLSKGLLIIRIDHLKELISFLFSDFIFRFQLGFFLGNHVCFWSSFSQKEWFA